MTAHQRWQHACAAYSMLYRCLDSHRDEREMLMLAATRVRQAGDSGLAAQIEELADDWFPTDSELRLMLGRIAELERNLKEKA